MSFIMLFEFLISLTDVYIAGKVGKEIQAAYGFVIQLYFIFVVVANALTVGTVSVVSRLFAAGKGSELAEAVFSSFIAAAAAGLLTSSAGYFLAAPLVQIASIPGELKPMAISLVTIYAVGLFFHYLLINTNGVLRSCGRVTTSLRTMAAVCGLNIALNFILVFHTPLSYRGIALATAISVCAGSLLNLPRIRGSLIPGIRFSFSQVRKMALIGWPMGLLQVLWLLASMVIFLILSALPTNQIEVLAAFTAGLRIESAIYLPAFAFNLANAVVVGNFLGERKPEDAFRAGLVTAGIGVGVVSVMAVAVIIGAGWIAPLLSDHPVVIQESVRYLYISMISEPFMAWGMILGGALSGAGDTRSALLRVGLSLWLIRIPLCYLAVIHLGLGQKWVWWAMNISQIIQGIWISKRYLSKEWL